jgi:hypothetical protein
MEECRVRVVETPAYNSEGCLMFSDVISVHPAKIRDLYQIIVRLALITQALEAM